MTSIQQKNNYILLTDKELIKYLENVDIKELIHSCKFIYNKCKKYTINSLSVNYDNLPKSESKDLYSSIYTQDFLNKQTSRIAKLVDGRQQYTSFLKLGPELNYFTLTRLINNFTNLISLELNIIIAPLETIQIIFNNLKNLKVLNLITLVVAIPPSEASSSNLKLPKYLNNLQLIRSRQLITHINDPINLNQQLYSLDFSKISFINIYEDSMLNLKKLSFQDSEPLHNYGLSRLLTSNKQLTTLDTTFSNLNNQSFNTISVNQNLSKLSIDFFYYEIPSSIEFPTDLSFPHIKSLQFNTIPEPFIQIVKNFINNCINLEVLECYLTPRYELEEILKYNQLSKLKKLIINNYAETCKAKLIEFPPLNLEYIEFSKFDPLFINFNIFKNLKKLKRVKISFRRVHLDSSNLIHNLYDTLNGWRVDYFSLSLNCWKI